MADRRGPWLSAVVCLALCAGCHTRRPPPTVAAQLDLAAAALREGRFDEAAERIRVVRSQAPRDPDAAAWSSVIAEMAWRHDDAVREMGAAVRAATAAGLPADEVAELLDRLGDLLFQAGRWEEAAATLRPDGNERRQAFASIARQLPPQRRPDGPLVTEQPLLPGAVPEFVCGAGGRLRPFAIDTGTSMTTLARTFADELAVEHRRSAGRALDSGGRELAVDVAVLPRFQIGDVEMGATPVLVVDDGALGLRDLFGGPERVPRGVLGLDLLAAVRLTIDPERRSVAVELPRGLPPERSVQCVRVDGRCLAPVHIEGVLLWFVLDTGASHSSLSEAGVLRLPGGEGRAVPSFRRVRTVGGGGVVVREVRSLVLRCSDARFEGVTLPVVARGRGELFPVHGVLGIDLLARCRVTLDGGRARLVALP